MEKTGVAQAALPCVKRLRNSDTNLLRPRSVVPCPTNIFSHPPMEVKYKKKAHGELSPQNLSWREGICSPKPGTGVRRPGASQLSPAASGGPRRRFGGTCKRFRRRRACFVFLIKIGLPSLVGFEPKQRKPPLLFEKHSFGDAGNDLLIFQPVKLSVISSLANKSRDASFSPQKGLSKPFKQGVGLLV